MSGLGDTFKAVLADKIRTIPEKADVVATVQQRGRILAVKGAHDYLDKVLPHCYAAEKVLVEPRQPPASLQGFDVVLVGCPGKLSLRSWKLLLEAFLAEGGTLVTTDWALQHLIEPLFPGTISKKGTAQGAFALRVRNPASPLLQGIADCGGTPWIVEAASHRIGILDPKRVDVVLDAPSMGETSTVLATFGVGKGWVVHAISHFHLQGSEKTGEYVSAYLLTNVIDEAIRRRYLAPANPVSSRIRVVAKETLKIRVVSGVGLGPERRER